MSDDLLQRLWGKASSNEAHPAVLHMLDVAAVALELLDQIPQFTRELLLRPGGDRELAPDAVALLVACHDLGKISPGFQAKVPRLWEALPPELRRPVRHPETRHGVVTFRRLPRYLVELGMSQTAARVIAQAVGGHHGKIPQETRNAKRDGSGLWEDLREQTFRALQSTLEVQDLPSLPSPRSRWILLLAGFTTVADWIGSSHHFPYRPGTRPSRDYLSDRRRDAEQVLEHLGWRRWSTGPGPFHFAELFPDLAREGGAAEPRGLQATVSDSLESLEPGSLLILEAATGSGKTEASLLAATALCRDGGLGGLYYALPTQATSNQMFQRVRAFLERLPGLGPAQLHLLHGQSDLEPSYADLIERSQLHIRSIGGPAARGIEPSDEGDDGAGDLAAEVSADEWFRARKRGLLSTVAVGTVDQAMVATLQAKHFFVRLFGLAGKVLVIDEVHAYDTFMSTIQETLLGWLATFGSTVILLSATLPKDRREALLAAWTPEAAQDDEPGPPEATPSLPRLTWKKSSGATRCIAGPAPTSRIVQLSPVEHEVSSIAARLGSELEGGGCVAWITNTVARAQRAFEALTNQGFTPDVDLLQFHARFPVEDRLERERRLLHHLSKRGDRPRRLVAVTTQVVEQSLDLDFDLMVSDLAPIDLMIQRVGRIHRHPREGRRPPGLGTPRLLWSSPPLTESLEAWRGACLPYDGHVQLRTRLVLEGREALVLPEQSDDLLAEVYGEVTSVPASFATLWNETADELRNQRDRAQSRGSEALVRMLSDPDEQLRSIHSALDDDEASRAHAALRARTRDMDQTTPVACLFTDGEETFLDPLLTQRARLTGEPSGMLQRQLQRRIVNLSGRWARRAESLHQPRSWRRCAHLRQARLIRFSPEGRPAGEDTTHDWIELDSHRGVLLGS